MSTEPGGSANRSVLVERYGTDGPSTEFWTYLASGCLALPWCRNCEVAFFFPRRFCPTCHSPQVDWRFSEGAGTVFASSEVHVAFQGLDASELPVVVGLVDLDEGVRLPARFGPPSGPGSSEEFPIGARVTIRFGSDPSADLPCFERAPE